VDTFRFAISLVPADAAYLTLLREIATQMSRLAGLDGEDGRRAVDALADAVRDRIGEASGAAAPVRIAFERAGAGAPVTVEITSSGRHEESSTQRLTWGPARQD
jgi:hypothetical protein